MQSVVPEESLDPISTQPACTEAASSWFRPSSAESSDEVDEQIADQLLAASHARLFSGGFFDGSCTTGRETCLEPDAHQIETGGVSDSNSRLSCSGSELASPQDSQHSPSDSDQHAEETSSQHSGQQLEELQPTPPVQPSAALGFFRNILKAQKKSQNPAVE